MNTYKHYVRLDEQSRVIKGFSEAMEQPGKGDVCICEDGGRHFAIDGSARIKTMQGVPLYKWTGKAVKKRTQKEIDADLAALQEQVEAQREAEAVADWQQDNMRMLAHLVDTGIIAEDELADKVQAMTDAPTDEVEWVPGTWYEAGATVYTGAGKYLVTRPHMAQAHYPPGSDGVHNYAPLPKIVDDYPEYEPGMIVHQNMVVWDTAKKQLYYFVQPTGPAGYPCYTAPSPAVPAVWLPYKGDV